jgi:hypothetical protein
MDKFSLENELRRRAEKLKHADARDLLGRFEAMRNYLSLNYYDWIQTAAPYLTNHGRLHIESVAQALDGLLGKIKPDQLSSLDLFLLLTAVLWHDVGNAYGRTEHASRVAELTNKVRELGFPNPDIQRLVVEIAKAHSGSTGLLGVRAEEDCATEHKTYIVYPRALAALVRFADEISENRARISATLIDSVPDENRIYWEYANSISASRPDPGRSRVVLTVNVDSDRAVWRFPCHENSPFNDAAGKISVIEYIVARLEKMNNERVYASQYMSRYAAIDAIECRFSLQRGTERDSRYENTFELGNSGLSAAGKYPNIPIAAKFFEQFPHWKPASLTGAVDAQT